MQKRNSRPVHTHVYARARASATHAHTRDTESIEGRHTRTDLKGQRLKYPAGDVPLIAKIGSFVPSASRRKSVRAGSLNPARMRSIAFDLPADRISRRNANDASFVCTPARRRWEMRGRYYACSYKYTSYMRHIRAPQC